MLCYIIIYYTIFKSSEIFYNIYARFEKNGPVASDYLYLFSKQTIFPACSRSQSDTGPSGQMDTTIIEPY